MTTTSSVETGHLHGTTDPNVWAETFAKVRSARLADDGVDIAADDDTMASWFANAFMAGWDKARSRG